MVSEPPTGLPLDLAEHTEEGRLHPMAVQSVLPERGERCGKDLGYQGSRSPPSQEPASQPCATGVTPCEDLAKHATSL